MGDNNHQRKGSLQFYPRVRASKVIPNVNWSAVKRDSVNFMGFVGYKVSMTSAWVKDDTEHSMTKGKRIAVPATILECPSMKIYSIRFYKDGRAIKDFVVANDKILKKKVRLSKSKKDSFDVSNYDDVRAILYTNVKNTSVDKSKPDMVEIALSGKKEEKLAFLKERVGKEILVSEVFSKGLVDVRGVTKGKGTQGPVKKFGLKLKDHKSEKGVRRPGSLSAKGLGRITFRAPQAGQLGYHNRIDYNHPILKVGKITEKDINPNGGFNNYGKIRNEYVVLKGSVPGPQKRGIFITPSIRPTKKIAKLKYEVLELR